MFTLFESLYIVVCTLLIWSSLKFCLFNSSDVVVVFGFCTILTAKVIIMMAVNDAHVFPGFLTQVLTQLSF